MPEVVKEDKRKKKPTVLEGGNRVAVSELEAAQIMGLKESDTFREKFVPEHIQPSYFPDSKRPSYNIFEVLGLFGKTKKKEEQPRQIVDVAFIERVRKMAQKTIRNSASGG
ncbi:MAG: hypothetical protein M0P61_00075 [Ignavibacteriaceae bacterium]|jgi:hypothetical protein|nr:hypothetical protein [Ignavibacteriaceae bacterium]